MHRESYTEREWQTLEYAVLWVFEAVADRDGKIDGREVAVLTDALHDESYKSTGSLVGEVWSGVRANYDTLRRTYHDDPRDIPTGLGEVTVLLRTKVSAVDAEDFRRALLQFGVDVARASGGFLGFGEKVSQDEREALDKIGVILGASIDT